MTESLGYENHAFSACESMQRDTLEDDAHRGRHRLRARESVKSNYWRRSRTLPDGIELG